MAQWSTDRKTTAHPVRRQGRKGRIIGAGGSCGPTRRCGAWRICRSRRTRTGSSGGGTHGGRSGGSDRGSSSASNPWTGCLSTLEIHLWIMGSPARRERARSGPADPGDRCGTSGAGAQVRGSPRMGAPIGDGLFNAIVGLGVGATSADPFGAQGGANLGPVHSLPRMARDPWPSTQATGGRQRATGNPQRATGNLHRSPGTGATGNKRRQPALRRPVPGIATGRPGASRRGRIHLRGSTEPHAHVERT